MVIRSRVLLTSGITPFKDGIVPASEGCGEYIRNTTLKKRYDGYSKRWRHYAGTITNYGRLPWEERSEAMAYGTWFAVPHIGRRTLSSPLFHIITSNHNIQPYLYKEMFPEDQSLQYYGEHDFTPEITTSTFDGLHSCARFACDINETYHHLSVPLNISICHLSHEDSITCLKKNFPSESTTDSDEVQFPFHFQMLAFDCRPVIDSEVVMVHGHRHTDTDDVTPKMIPTIIKCKVSSTETMKAAGVFLIETIDPEEEFEPGISGAPVLRDGRVVGLLTTVKLSTGEGIVSISLHMRRLILDIEERWRYPTPPPYNLLKQRGLLTAEEQSLKQLPPRYELPPKLPRPLSSSVAREFIDTKINNPLPVDFAPPKLLSQNRHQIVSRDRTNPFGEDPVDGGYNIPSLQIFPGYDPAPLIQDDADKPPWLLRYGSQQNYLLAHGVDPSDTDQYQPFKNYISPLHDKSIDKQVLLSMDEGERPFGLLRDKTEVKCEALIKADNEPEEISLLQESFGEEEYVLARQQRVQSTIASLKHEERLAIESGVPDKIEAVKKKIIEFHQMENDISWARGDRSIRPSSSSQVLLPSDTQETVCIESGISQPEEEQQPREEAASSKQLSPEEAVRLKISTALKNASSSVPSPAPVNDTALRSMLSKGTSTRVQESSNTNDIIWGESAFSLDEEDQTTDVPRAEYSPVDTPSG
eukprot:TRINITY_DN14002_c0_g1_i1.p1 TRINITY_DN14002_c0_g1~~TRINITY_DN14002_c0_g1_i1.p1  ORF type:complete len:699 (+),score=154.86 TRINITY_DN14002_c0_g1_i1:47-2143(+)